MLGFGGYGVVIKAEDLLDKKVVVLKVYYEKNAMSSALNEFKNVTCFLKCS